MSDEQKNEANWTINTVATLVCTIVVAIVAFMSFRTSAKQDENRQLLETIGLKQDVAMSQFQLNIAKEYLSKTDFAVEDLKIHATFDNISSTIDELHKADSENASDFRALQQQQQDTIQSLISGPSRRMIYNRTNTLNRQPNGDDQ